MGSKDEGRKEGDVLFQQPAFKGRTNQSGEYYKSCLKMFALPKLTNKNFISYTHFDIFLFLFSFVFFLSLFFSFLIIDLVMMGAFSLDPPHILLKVRCSSVLPKDGQWTYL